MVTFMNQSTLDASECGEFSLVNIEKFDLHRDRMLSEVPSALVR